MLMNLQQVTVVYLETFRVLKENREICSSRALKILPSMTTKSSNGTSCKACTTATTKVRLAFKSSSFVKVETEILSVSFIN